MDKLLARFTKRREMHTHTHKIRNESGDITTDMMFGRNEHNSVKQLPFN